MKKSKDFLLGIFSLAFYYLALILMFVWEINDKYIIIQSILFYILPMLPGVALAILLKRNSLKEFFKSWSICFLASACMFLIWNDLGVSLAIHNCITGLEEFSLGDGILMVCTSFLYMVSCTVGCIVAGIISLYRQKKNKSIRNNTQSDSIEI